jgi:hypothetical protein
MLALIGGAAQAAPLVSRFPLPRPAVEASETRPLLRPESPQEAAAVAEAAVPLLTTRLGLAGSPRPETRPRLVASTAAGGGLCGRPTIGGERIPAVSGRGGCGIESPVRVTHVSGLALSRPARMDCETARALDDWAARGVLPVVGGAGGGAVGLYVAAGYACRTRNSQRGARLSEHARGRAIDISGIRLANGNTITVLSGWRSSAHGPKLRELHRRACGIFGTVLGPESDRFHQDHFHFDTARYRSGSYCR